MNANIDSREKNRLHARVAAIRESKFASLETRTFEDIRAEYKDLFMGFATKIDATKTTPTKAGFNDLIFQAERLKIYNEVLTAANKPKEWTTSQQAQLLEDITYIESAEAQAESKL